MKLYRLPELSRFRLADMPWITGQIIRVNEGSVTVRADTQPVTHKFTDRKGKEREFTTHQARETTWSRMTEVERI